MRRLLLPLCVVLGACMPVAPHDTVSRAAPASDASLPPIKSFAHAQPKPPLAANSDIARDFLDLAFTLESGRLLPFFSRFEGPVSLRVTGAAPAHLGADLDAVLHRLRTEAGIAIARTDAENANITIQAVSRAEIQKNLPQAACFVVPNISNLSEYAGARRTQRTDWARITQRQKLAIFLPNDTSPQEVRDCLHEELAQALGPLNDLYRLSDSVFNDDNMHTVLTGFDMLILRAFYSPALRSGMTRAEVAARLPAILAQLNPAGQSRVPQRRDATPLSWVATVQQALGPGTPPQGRLSAARSALNIARVMGWYDHRMGFSHYAMGRILQADHPAEARLQFQAAYHIYSQLPECDLHMAYVSAALAAYAIADGDATAALALIAPAEASAAQHENAALLAQLLMLRAEALDLTGRSAEAEAVRLDSLGWARYGFGADWAVRAKLREVAALNPLKDRS